MRFLTAAIAAVAGASAALAASAPRPMLLPAATAMVLSPYVRIGAVDPRVKRAQDGEIRILVRSAAPWQLALSPRSLAGGTETSGSRSAAQGAAPASAIGELAVRSQAGRTIPVMAGGVVPVAAGGPTPPGGQLLMLPVVTLVRFASLPGRRSADLDVLIDGRPTGASVRIDFDVIELLELVPDPRPFELSGAPDPTRPGLWRFDKRTYRVVSNVPWLVQVALGGAPKETAASRTLCQNAIVLMSGGQPRAPLAAGQPVTIASGAATGDAGTDVDVELGLAVAGGEIEGDYVASLAVAARPATAVIPTTVVRSAERSPVSGAATRAGE